MNPGLRRNLWKLYDCDHTHFMGKGGHGVRGPVYGL